MKVFSSLILGLITVVFIWLGIIIFKYETMNVFEYSAYIMIWLILLFVVYMTFNNINKDIINEKKGLKFNKKYDAVFEIDYFVKEIEKLKGYKKIIKSDNGLILINEAGIFEIRIILGKGTLKGDALNKIKLNEKEIKNPFILDDSLKYLVLTRNVLYKLANVRLVSKSKLVFVLENHLNKKVLTEKEIDDSYLKIGKKDGNN